MQRIKRIAGIVILFVCGFLALFEIICITVLVDVPKDYFFIAAIFVALATAVGTFFLARFGLRLLETEQNKSESIDQIGQEL